MAIIRSSANAVYVFVENEEITRDIEVSTHAVEDGFDITDTVRQKPAVLSISGKIVDYPSNAGSDEQIKAATALSILSAMKNSGELVTYEGRNICWNMQIVNFSTRHPNTVWGGAEFDIELRECRIAKNAYIESAASDESGIKDGGQQQIDKGENEEVWYSPKEGDSLYGLIMVKGDGNIGDYAMLVREGDLSGCDWVYRENPAGFSRPGDISSMIVSKKQENRIYMGQRRR